MPAQKREPSGQSTRERLLAASLVAFGQRDYDAVSTREIVDQAGSNISAISYHFGGKRQLYLATADYLANRVRHGLAPYLDEISPRLERADEAACRAMLQQLIHGLVENLLLREFSQYAAGFIFREQNHPTEAFDILYEKLMLPLQSTYAGLLAGILGVTAESKDNLLLTHALLGQILGFRFAQTTILRRLGTDKLTREDIAKIGQLIADLTLAAIQAPRLHR